ncbi:hypothetical protein IW261DRAFT_802090 [Armillaria novae-zelandiae]|uniref:Uncharacterized protein n=1 Tax=Armillaria novae-zelandiae TaxID=153914 RepID=A0AA39PLK1_9AGAR|nr:hypothetical protein IW261DRAFT_802090 [Armillaria novae-zelandiae]
MKLLAFVLSAITIVASAPMGSGDPTDAVDIASRAPVSLASESSSLYPPPHVVQNAGNPGFYYCKDANFENTCTYSTTAGGVCITFAPGDAWIDNISSVRPDVGMTCTLYSAVKCKGNSLPVTEEMPSLTSVGWNDLTRSYVCSRK